MPALVLRIRPAASVGAEASRASYLVFFHRIPAPWTEAFGAAAHELVQIGILILLPHKHPSCPRKDTLSTKIRRNCMKKDSGKIPLPACHFAIFCFPNAPRLCCVLRENSGLSEISLPETVPGAVFCGRGFLPSDPRPINFADFNARGGAGLQAIASQRFRPPLGSALSAVSAYLSDHFSCVSF
jgi:hypothetical protein